MGSIALQEMITYYNRERSAEAVAKADKDTINEQIAAHTAQILAKCIQSLAWGEGIEVEVYRVYKSYTRRVESGKYITEEINFKQAKIAEET